MGERVTCSKGQIVSHSVS